MMARLDAVLFDMDGVVADTKATVTAFWKNLAVVNGMSLSDDDLDQHVYGRTSSHTICTLFPMITEAQLPAVLNSLREYEMTLTYKEISGVTALIRSLREFDVPVALVTGAEPWKVEAVLAQLQLANMFTAQVHAREVRSGKPDPACYLLAATRLSVDPERCVAFEDAGLGVEAAVRAGMTCVGVGPPVATPELLEAGAIVVIDNFDEVEVEPMDVAATSRAVKLRITRALGLTVGV